MTAGLLVTAQKITCYYAALISTYGVQISFLDIIVCHTIWSVVNDPDSRMQRRMCHLEDFFSLHQRGWARLQPTMGS